MQGSRMRLAMGLWTLAALAGCGGDNNEAAALPVGCEQITSALLAAPGVSVSTAQSVTSGSFTPPGSTTALTNLPAFCRMAVTIKPTAESNINAEVWMPQTWNGKLVAVGNGGLAGSISYSDMAPVLRAGYATASTDTGHTTADTTWLTSRQKQTEYMSTSIHETTVVAKNLVQKHYGRAQSRTYYSGCSTGGGQGFAAIQRFPADFDGVVAGAPQNFPTHFRPALIAAWQAANATPSSVLGTTTMSNLTKAVLSQCGGATASADGFLMNPQACTFDPTSMQCGPGQSGPSCLTGDQVTAVRSIYAGLRAPNTNILMWPGLSPGSEQPAGLPGWSQMGTAGGAPFSTASLFFRIGVLQNPDFDLKQMDFGPTVRRADDLFSTAINNIGTNIQPFTSRGGKLLMYHGWADNLISPQNSINYFETLVDESGSRATTQASTRLFMVPGLGHCSGGPGPTQFDKLEILDAWVDRGIAPDRIVASSTTTPAFTRPLCPYPQVAEYSGTGDRAAAANWQCVAKTPIADREFYKRGLNIF